MGRLALVTRIGHDLVMKPVRIADLKSRLSEYLRAVRKGRSITVLDRETPIARIVPYEPETNGVVVRRARGKSPFGKLPLPKPSRTTIDVVRILLEERQSER